MKGPGEPLGFPGVGRIARITGAEKGSRLGRTYAGDVWAPVRSVLVPEKEGREQRIGAVALGYWK